MTKKKPAPYVTAPADDFNWDAGEEFLNSLRPPEAPQETGVARRVGDLGVSLAKGVIGVPEAVVGLADIPTGGRVGRFLENPDGTVGFRPKQAKAMLDELFSPAQQDANRKVQEAKGLGGTIGAVVSNPSTVVHAVAESLPSMVGGGVAARGLMKVAPRMGAIAAGATGEGLVTAGQQAESIRQETADGLLTPQQSAIAGASGVLTGGLGVLGGRVAKKLGIGDVDTLLAGGGTAEAQKGFVRSLVEGAVSEGLFEELPQSVQEQVAQNLALGKPLDEGVNQAAVLGAISGGVMGGAAGPMHRTPGEALRARMLPENGPMSRAVNAGIAFDANAADAALAAARAPKETVLAAPIPSGNGIDFEADPLFAQAPTFANGAAPTAQVFGTEQAANIAIGERGLMGSHRAVPGPNGGFEIQPAGAQGVAMVAPGIYEAPAAPPASTPAVQRPDPSTLEPQPSLGPNPARLEQSASEAQATTRPAATAPSEFASAPEPSTGTGEFASADDAQRYISQQRRAASANLPPALPRQFPDGTFGVSAEGQAEFAQAQADDRARRHAAAGIEPTDILNKAEDPFKNRLAANHAVKKHGGSIVPVTGGFVVRPGAAPTAGTAVATSLPPEGAPADSAVQAPSSVVREILNASGKPFKAQLAARHAQRKNGGEIVPVDGGFAVRVTPAAVMDQAANQAATSPHNDHPEPTEAQKKAGNYKLGHHAWKGLDLSFENPKGSDRKGVDPNGKPWSVTMPAHYGYVKRSTGADGDHVDVYMGDSPESDQVFVIDQQHADTGKWDEHKVVLGSNSLDEATALYDAGFSDGKGPQRRSGVTPMSVDQFKAWLKGGDTTRPVAPSRPGTRDATQSDITTLDEPDAPPESQPAQDVEKAGAPRGAETAGEAADVGVPATPRSGDAETPGLKPKPAPAGAQKNATTRRAATEREARRSAYYAPGNIVRGWAGYDRVLRYKPPADGKPWSVSVQQVVKSGDEWVVHPTEGRERTHSTEPEEKEYRTGPVAGIGQRPASVVDAGEKSAGYSAHEGESTYQSDLFGQPLPGRNRSAKSGARGVSRDIRSVADLPGDTPRPDGEYLTRTTVGSEVRRKLGSARIESAADAAAATRYLYDSAVERLDGIVTDAQGVPLAIVGGFKGALSQAAVYPATLMGEAVRVRGAARIWFSHNHPSGISSLSRADEHLSATLAEVFRGSGIEPQGLIAVGKGEFSHVDAAGNLTANRSSIPASTESMAVPAIERVLASMAHHTMVDSPAVAKAAAKAHFDKAKSPGLLLLNSQHAVIGWVPVTPPMTGTLRHTGGLNAIYRAVSEANAGAAILVHDGSFDAKVVGSPTSVGANIAAALQNLDVRPIDSINTVTGSSAAEQGDRIAGGAVFSRATPHADVGERAALAALSRTDEMFELKKSDKDTVEGIVADNDPQIKVKSTALPNGETVYTLTMPNGRHAYLTVRKPNPYGPRVFGYDMVEGEAANQITERPGDNADAVPETAEDVWIDVSRLEEGGAGTRVYNIAATYAHNTGRIFIGDPAGLSDEALRRRSEQMLSSALKFGTTEHLAPHPRQVAGDAAIGVPPLAWVYGDDLGNIRRLIDVNLGALDNAFPGASAVGFDLSTGKYVNAATGKPLDRLALAQRIREVRSVPNSSASVARAGSRTVERGAVFRALLRDEGGSGGSGGGRDGLLARLAELGADARAPIRKIFYSRPAPAPTGRVVPPGRVTEIQALIDTIVERWSNAPKIQVVSSLQDERVPQAVRDNDTDQLSQGAAGKPAGFFYAGQAYLVADQLGGDADVLRVLFHEVLGHYGLRNTFGKDLGVILDRLAILNAGKVRAKAKAYGLDYDKLSDRRIAVEEVLAEMAEKTPELGWVKRAIAAIRTWLRKHVPGFGRMAMSDAEIISSFILPARRFVEQPGAEVLSQFSDIVPSNGAEGTAVFSRSFAGVLKQASTARGLSELVSDQFTTQKTFNGWWHKSVGTQYHKASVSPEFKKVFDRAQDFLHDTSAFAIDAAGAAPDLLPQLNGFKDVLKRASLSVVDQKAIAKAVFQGTLTDKKVYGHGELQSLFGLSDQQVDLYRQFRVATDRSLDLLAAAEVSRQLGDQLMHGLKAMVSTGDTGRFKGLVLAQLATDPSPEAKQALALVEQKYARIEQLKEEGYAPLMRFGRHSVDVLDAQGERVHFGLYESQGAANAAAREFRATPGLQITQGLMSQESFKQFQGIAPETLEIFAEMAGVEQSELFQQYLKLAVANRSALKRLIERKGIAGFSEDPTRVLASFITSNARAASGNLHLGDLSRAVAEIPKHKGDVLDEAQKLRDYLQNPTEEAQAIRGLLFTQYIGGSIASAMVNMTQPLTMTYPFLAQHGGAAKAASRLIEGMKGAVAGVQAGDLKVALKMAEAEGVVSPQEIHQLQAEASRSLSKNAYVRKGLFLWGSLFSLAEQFNRRATFIAAYNTAKAEGMADPYAFAADAVGQTQGIYNRANKPNWARGALGGTLFTFKQYSIGYLEFLKRLPPKERALALAVLMIAAGAQGLPGADDLDDVIDTIAQGLGYDFNSKQQKARFLTATIGEGGADFVLRGFSALPGFPLDVAGRMSVGNLIPGTGMLLKSKTDKSDEVMEVAGPAGAIARDALKTVESGDLTKVLPTALRNLWKGIEMFQTGEYRDTKGRNVLDVGAGDALAKAIGFQPADVARSTRKSQIAYQQIALARSVESEIAGEWAQGIVDQKPGDVAAARARLAEWNARNPDTPIAITRPQVARRAREMRLTREDRIEKSAPKELRRAVLQ